MKPVTTYLDMRNQPTELTSAELEWFYGLADLARRATGLSIDIIPYDHELYKGKSKNALGCCCTLDTDDPLGPDADSYITIDCYFIHEKFAELFEGMRSIERQSVIDVIAHEIAHLYCWRHGKKHSRITEEIERKIADQAVADASRKATETSSDPFGGTIPSGDGFEMRRGGEYGHTERADSARRGEAHDHSCAGDAEGEHEDRL